jgi:hypothetical protein
MKLNTTITLAAVFTAGMALVPMPAKAICDQTFYADYAFTDGTTAQIVGHPVTAIPPPGTILIPYTYSAESGKPVIASLIFAAVASRNPVRVIGDVGTCPPPPTTVPAPNGTVLNLGNIIQIIQYP